MPQNRFKSQYDRARAVQDALKRLGGGTVSDIHRELAGRMCETSVRRVLCGLERLGNVKGRRTRRGRDYRNAAVWWSSVDDR